MQFRDLFGQRRGIFLDDRFEGAVDGFFPEDFISGKHFVEDRSEGKDVGAMIDRFATHLLGGHVAGRTRDAAAIGLSGHGVAHLDVTERRAHEFRQSEVENFHPTILSQEQVLGFKIAVDDALGVGGGEALGNLCGHLDGFGSRQRASGHTGTQRLTLQKFGDEIGAAFVGSEVEDRQDVGMVERSRRAGFLLETPQAILVGGEGWSEDFDRHFATKPWIAAPVDHAHSARS